MVVQSFLKKAMARLRRDRNKARFTAVARRVLDTPALKMTGDSPVFTSQLCERDVVAYLLAIKSLYRRIGMGRICIIDDGSLTADSHALLARHLPVLEIVDIRTIDVGGCPRGGTWERLCHIVDMSQTQYVIQVDSDTLTVFDVPEVRECWQNGRPFLLGTGSGKAVVSAGAVATMVRGWIADYGWNDLSLSVEAEAALDQLSHAQTVSYVHASSGFAGFAPRSVNRGTLEQFSQAMVGLLGPSRWKKWGSEQVASNFVLANAAEAVVLPHPLYTCVEANTNITDSIFLHFLGSHRYETDKYRLSALQVLKSMASDPD